LLTICKEKKCTWYANEQTISKVGKVTKLVDGHVSNRYHGDTAEAALAFKRSVEQRHDNVDVCLNMEQVHENRHSQMCSMHTVL